MLGKLGNTFSKLGASSGSSLGWIPNPTNKPDIAINWSSNKAWTKTGGLTTPTALGVTTSRASVKQVVDGSGNWSQVASNVTAQSNLGRSTEEARTNSIRNNTMQGAVAGTPGTLPTNWVVAPAAGLTTNVISSGTQNGIDYVDVQIVGTGNATGFYELQLDSNTAIAALYGQSWTFSCFAAVIAGSNANLNQFGLGINENNSGGTAVVAGSSAGVGLFTASLSRVSISRTLNNTATAFMVPFVGMNFTPGAVINFTLRIGWPQLENNSINSTVASATVAAGGASGVTGTAVYSVGGGTGTAATLNVTVSGGAITAINSVASAGSYSVFPPSPAALTYVSGTGSGVVGATVNLTPASNAANAFATSPIKTTAGAATRAADVTVLTGQTFGSALSLYSAGTPQAPDAYGATRPILSADDGTLTNRNQLFRAASSAAMQGFMSNVSGNSQFGTRAITTGTAFKSAATFAANVQVIAINGAAAETAAAPVTGAPVVNQIGFGKRADGGSFWNGLATIDAIWLTQAVTSAELVTMTT